MTRRAVLSNAKLGRRPLLHLPELEWPAADRAAFAKAFAEPHNIFSDHGGGTHLRPCTRDAICFGYRRWLGWISTHHPELLAVPPESRATLSSVKAYVAHLRLTCRERSVATEIRYLHDALRYMYPEHDWSWLRDIKARLERAIPKTGRKPVQLTSQRVIDASLDSLDRVDAEFAQCHSTASRKALQTLALRYRDGLLVALVCFFPIRRSNLAELMIGTTICRGPSIWSVCIPGEGVKNKEPATADLPEWISERVDRFVDVYRPLIHRSATHPGLWASAKGQPATGDALYNAFQKETASSLGQHLTLHDARRIAATTWVVHDPANAAGAKDLLGDRSDRVFAQHYNLASGIEASRKMAQIVSVLKLAKAKKTA